MAQVKDDTAPKQTDYSVRYFLFGYFIILITVVIVLWFNSTCLCMNAPPQIIECNVQEISNHLQDQRIRPQDGIFKKGETIRLTADFENGKYYQWYQDGTRIEGCTGNTLIIENAIIENTGAFSLVVANEDFETTTMKIEIV